MSPNFKTFLELDPLLRETLINFHGSRYAKCLKMLDDMRETLMCDLYLAGHISTLFGMIRSKAMVQYFR